MNKISGYAKIRIKIGKKNIFIKKEIQNIVLQKKKR